MTMKRSQVFFLLLSIVFLAAANTGCDKEKSNEEMLIGVWEVQKYGGSQIEIPWIIEFKKGGSYLEALTVLEEYIEYKGKWELGSTQEIILVEIESDTKKKTIKKLTDNDLWYLDIDNITWELKKQ